MTLVESYAVDICGLMHRAAEAEKKGDMEQALRSLEEAKSIHQDAYYFVWNKGHTSGTVK